MDSYQICKLNEDMINEATNVGEYKKAVKVATKMILNNLPLDMVVECSELSLEEVEELSQNLKKTE